MNVMKESRLLQDKLVSMRRDLHRIPEIGFTLPETRKYITNRLEAMGIGFTLNEEDSGLIAYINKGKPGKILVLRSDMDALPITEETGADYASEHEDMMHACGHDAHMAMLLGTAEILKRHENELKGEIRLLFQSAEEIAGGVKTLIKHHAMAGADAVFGIHIGTLAGKEIPTGTFLISPGPVMASFDRFAITVLGKGCHGSTPENGIDPINIAAHIILSLEGIVTREISGCTPAVISVGMIHGGSYENVIPDIVQIKGTIRSFDEEIRQKLARRLEEVSRCCAQTFGGVIAFELFRGIQPLINDAGMAAFAAGSAAKVVGSGNVLTQMKHPLMGSDNFSCYLEQAPGAYLFLSSSNPEKGTDVDHHNCRFEIDEDVLWEGTAVFAQIAVDFA